MTDRQLKEILLYNFTIALAVALPFNLEMPQGF
jgi:hypothetical protein